MRVRIEDIDTYKKLISGEGGGDITPIRGPLPIKLMVDYENIPEGSTKVAICSGEDGVYAFGLTDIEASAYKYNNLYLIPDDIPTNVALAVKKSQKEVEEGGETYTEDVYELTSGIGINLNTCLDFSDNSVIYVGAWEAKPQSQFDAGSYIWDQLTEDKIISGEELEGLDVANMSPTDSAVTHAILDKAENVYKLGGMYIAVIPESTFVPVKTLVPLKKSWYS